MDRHEYMELLSKRIRCRRAIPMVLREIETHIEEQKEEFLSEGMNMQEAEEAAVREMGDPVAVGIELNKIHQPKIAWSLFGMVVILSALGIVIQAMVELAVSSVRPQGWLYYLVSGVNSRNQILCVWGGVLLMVCICLMDYTWIGKYAVLLWGSVIILLIEYCMKTPNVNGKYEVAWSFSYLLIPIYAGIVWHYWQQGYKGLVKSTVILAMTGVFSICILVSISTMCLMVFIGVVMLQMAICQGGFGKSKRKNSAILWSVLFALPVVMGIGWMAVNGYLMGDYQWNRLSDFLRPEQNTIYQRIASGIKAMTENADVLGSIPYDSPDMSMIKGEYLWNYLYQAWGSGVGIALTLAEAVVVICLLLLVLRQKNQLGKMLGISCVLFLALQIIRYVSMNFGYAAPASVNMPFLSYGNINLMISYLYVGLGLSVHYNSNLINN